MFTGRRQRSRSFPRDCGSFTRDNSQAARSESRRISAAVPTNQPTTQYGFYERLLTLLKQPVFRDGDWRLLECTPAWKGNWTHDCFLVFYWQGDGEERRIMAVNYADHASQCHVRLPADGIAGKFWQLHEQLQEVSYDWHGDDLTGAGLYLDMSSWQVCIFSCNAV